MKRIVTTLAIAAAMAIGITSQAEAQKTCAAGAVAGPFCIDGIITDTDNSNVPATNASPPCAATSPQACKLSDPNGNTKELAPNNSSYKVGTINIAPLPMMDTETNNSQVDLNTVWIQSAAATNGDIWFYFAWARDSSNGSGFISIELGQNAAPVACNYTGVDFTNKNDAETAALIKTCNPWANRQEGDTLLLWDGNGSSTAIIKREYDGTKWGDPVTLGTAKAEYSADDFRGEAAINLTDDVFDPDGACSNIANIIPSTVTGNSDSADYKDTVFFTMTPISTCGTLVVNKVTDVAENGSFPYTVDRVSGNDLRFPDDGGEDELTGTLFRNLDAEPPDPTSDLSDTHSNLIAATDYRIGETVPTGWAFNRVECTISGSTTVSKYQANPAASIVVEAGKTTTCTIYNTLDKASPDAATTPIASVRLRDSATLSGVRRGTTETASTVEFRLYESLAACQADEDRDETVGTGGLLYTQTVNVTFADENATGTTVSTDSPGVLVTNFALLYHWWAKYSGNNLNDPDESGCGSETTSITITHGGTGAGSQ